jgi:hypothetical protein
MQQDVETRGSQPSLTQDASCRSEKTRPVVRFAAEDAEHSDSETGAILEWPLAHPAGAERQCLVRGVQDSAADLLNALATGIAHLRVIDREGANETLICELEDVVSAIEREIDELALDAKSG